MGTKDNVEFIESSSAEVFEIPGEPAIVINGLPTLLSKDTNLNPDCVTIGSQSQKRPAGFGEWLEGRDVRKLFGGKYFNGQVTQFDDEMGWYRVVYEDGDFEDLEWDELMEVIVPLDVNIPLTALAMKIIKKRQKPVENDAKGKVKARKIDGKGQGEDK